jgi:DNA helicase II / ATP-dependent DNA helicase PcrA
MNNLKTKYTERLAKLNDRQREAVETTEGAVMVVAAPGSGKTELLSLRAGYILDTLQVAPHNILLLTFTDSASYNMRERLVSLIGETGYRVNVFTFHSLASSIISQYGDYFFNGAKFRSATDIDQIYIIQNILSKLSKVNSLTSIHPEKGYVYGNSSLSAISDLKKGGKTVEKFKIDLDVNAKMYIHINQIIAKLENNFESIAGKRKLEQVLPTYIELYNNLKNLNKNKESIEENNVENKYINILTSSLELSLALSSESDKTVELTKWKDEYISKVDVDGEILFILSDSEKSKQQKMYDLYIVYREYEKQMYEKGLYDYDDMILMALAAIDKYPNLKYDLQERYQYIMVDEFQDTNDAQFALVKAISKNDTNIESNIMVVGDDDQAIYKFQGAEISNIFEFKNTFLNCKTIILDKNYRSSQEILDHAREVIVKVVDRLEIRDKNIIKNIKAENNLHKDLSGNIIYETFENKINEYAYVAENIKEKLSKGVNPKEIAVICRRHAELREFAQVLNAHNVPYSYEKRENVFDKEHVRQIINIIKFVSSYNKSQDESLLPEILSYKFWGLDSIDIWRLAELVREGSDAGTDELGKRVHKRQTWLATMIECDSVNVKNIATFLIELSVGAESMPLEYLIDKIIGTDEWQIMDDEKSDIEMNEPEIMQKIFISPFRSYYFGSELFERNKPLYLDFLFSLRTFIGALREFRQGQVTYAADLLDFLKIYEVGTGQTLSVVSPFATSSMSISLLTGHKAKGLEYEHVYILSADDNVWAGRGYSSNITFPVNMQYGANLDGEDDKIRLLYVALTRAKSHLTITNSDQKLRYLVNIDASESDKEIKEQENKNKVVEISDESIKTLNIIKQREFVQDERVLLSRLLENYKMPVTHLTNFLNFTRVGPYKFVEQNLLRFPQAMAAPAVYGSAMHEALERVYLHYAKFNKFMEIEQVLDNFTESMQRGRLPKLEQDLYIEKGLAALEIYYIEFVKKEIKPNTKVEVKFSNENVYMDTVHATGNIDKLEINEDGTLSVTDFKTGKSFKDFDSCKSDDEKIKLHFYKYQLAYYALLLENSNTYRGKRIVSGKIEFIEADANGKLHTIEIEIDEELKDRVRKLANVVYNKIMNLDFPDTSQYKESLKGILDFEEDLLSGNI